MRVPGWRVLAAFWVVVIGATAGGAVWLDRLGPPPAAIPQHAAAPAQPAAAPDQLGAVAVTDSPAPMPQGAQAEPPAPSRAAEQSDASSAVPGPGTPTPQDVAATAAAPPPAPSPTVLGATPPRAPEPPPLAAIAEPRAVARPIPEPDPALLEQGRHGMLPRAGADGRTSIRAYGRDFDRRDTRPRIGIIVADIGLNATQTEEAIRRLPPAVALALSPYAARPGQAAERARERGMETLISMPLEPAGYPLNNPGDRALLTGQSMTENMDRLDWVLARSQGYVGVIGALGAMRGERFATLTEAMGTVQDALRLRGLLYIDPRPGAASPARAWGRSVDLILDEPAGTRGEIDRRLAELEGIARDRGAALGLAGSVTPVLVERITAWSQGLAARGLVLAPVSAMIRRPEGVSAEAPTTPIRPASAP